MYEDGASGFTGQATTSTVHAGPLVIDLVTRARMGDKQSGTRSSSGTPR